MLQSYRRVLGEDAGVLTGAGKLLAGFAILGSTDRVPGPAIPILADELPVSAASRPDSEIAVRDWREHAPGGGTSAIFFKAIVKELSVGGHSEMIRVMDCTEKKNYDVHRSRILLWDPRGKENRGDRVNSPAQLEYGGKAAPSGGKEDGDWKVLWRNGPQNNFSACEHWSVLWHLRKGGDGDSPAIDRIVDVPWGLSK